MPPYIPLPYASDQPAYSNRDYTLKQMQLLEQQALYLVLSQLFSQAAVTV